MSREIRPPASPRPPLRPRGVLVGFALNTIAVSVVLLLGSGAGPAVAWLGGIALAGSVLAGLATALYVGQRGAIHAFLGGFLSAPLLAIFVLNGNWSFAVLAASFCAVGGILGEWRQRRRG